MLKMFQAMKALKTTKNSLSLLTMIKMLLYQVIIIFINNLLLIIISTDVREKIHFATSDLGELSDSEKEALSGAVKQACEGKSIRRVRADKIEESEFNNMTLGSVFLDNSSRRLSRQFSKLPNCTNSKVCCFCFFLCYYIFILDNLQDQT